MNGIEKITARIDAEVQAEIERILADARAEADRVAGGYQAQAKAEAAELKAKNEKAAAEREERLVSVAQMVEKAYALALDKLCSLPEAQYVETVADLLVKAAPAGHGAVIFAPAERERVGAAAVALANERLHGGRLTLADETRPLRGGFILCDGKVEVNCSFDTLVRLQKNETAGAVAKHLFPET